MSKTRMHTSFYLSVKFSYYNVFLLFLLGKSNANNSKELNCYIHAVSPVKKGALSGKEYFSCTLQKKDGVMRAVCFSPEKQDNVLQLGKSKSPVKIKNFQTKIYQGKPEIVMSKYTKITTLSKEDVNFNYSFIGSENIPTTTISALEKFGKDQLVNLKAEVTEISGTKKVNTQFQGQLTKQEVTIRDTTSYIRLVLWEQYVDTLKAGTTYMFNNLRLKVTNRDRYLNTAKTKTFLFDETTPFEQALVEVDKGHLVMTTSDVCGKIVGVQSITKRSCCSSCGKSLQEIPGRKIVQCSNENCKLLQNIESCDTRWCVRVLFKNAQLPSTKIRLTIFNRNVEELLNIIGKPFDLQTATEDELVNHILEEGGISYSITYDNIDNIVQSIEMDW